jgi:hypothetical protein
LRELGWRHIDVGQVLEFLEVLEALRTGVDAMNLLYQLKSQKEEEGQKLNLCDRRQKLKPARDLEVPLCGNGVLQETGSSESQSVLLNKVCVVTAREHPDRHAEPSTQHRNGDPIDMKTYQGFIELEATPTSTLVSKLKVFSTLRTCSS